MNDVMVAAGIFSEVGGMANELKTVLVGAVLGLMYVAAIVQTWAVTRSVVKAFGTALGGAVLLGVVASQTILSDRTAEELKEDHSAPAPAAVVRAGGGGGVGE